MSRDRAPRLGPPGPGARRATFVVPPTLAGERLDKALAAGVEELSRAKARKIIGMGAVYLGTERCRVASKPVAAGDALTVTWHPEVLTPERYELDVLHEDARVVVVNKPAQQLSFGSELGDVGSLAHALARRYGPEAVLMHRLDKPASGLLLVARDAAAAAALTPQVREHRMSRRYLAIAAGTPAAGWCETPLVKEGRAVRPAHPGEEGMPARSFVEVLRTEGAASLVRVTLETGRTHQIRVHLMSLGAPLVGDRRYGGPDAPRVCLHAAHLGFVHPDGHPLAFDVAPHDDFWAAAGWSRPSDLDLA
ncbi:MAG: RluA family pseudouridine synthase [Deltaproteobacteria bacterium]|nr:MAG: RluA family pseudouridine synthase [Deltaproteobacteria bacterium]